MNRFEGTLDAVLHLLDRQVVDSEGLMVCKVDDVELTEHADGVLAITGLLTGAPALIGRLGGRLGGGLLAAWAKLGVQHAGRTVPEYVALDRVAKLDHEVHLAVPRGGLLDRQGSAALGTHLRRLNDLLTMRVEARDGTALGTVLDVRIAAEPAPGSRLVAVALVVGRGRPGSMLGYDRHPDQGPWILNRAIRWWHRDTGLLDMTDVGAIEWDAGRVQAKAELRPLEAAL